MSVACTMPIRWLRLACTVAWFASIQFFAAAAAHAQALHLQPEELDAAVLSCLTPTVANAPKITYPKEALQLNAHGTVRVQLEFFSVDQAPRVKVLFSSADWFREPVLEL